MGYKGWKRWDRWEGMVWEGGEMGWERLVPAT